LAVTATLRKSRWTIDPGRVPHRRQARSLIVL
jgi:hypothetical protein